MHVYFLIFLISFSLSVFSPALESLAGQNNFVLSEERKTPKDMILIPAGVFEMGSTDPQVGADEHPQHTVSLHAFYLDRYEVTNREFRKFVKRHGFETSAEKQGKAWVYVEDEQWTEEKDAWWKKPEGRQSVFATRRGSHPVVAVSWDDANAYCQGVGKRLPTEAEWEYASRAGSPRNAWWGGKAESRSTMVGNVADISHKNEFPDRPWPVLGGYDDHYVRTAPVGTFEANAWGLHDMIGNAWEWVADWYSEDYYSHSPKKNPLGPSEGHFKVLRGGSWATSPEFLGTGVRIFNLPNSRNAAHGVRCAKDLE